VSILDGCPVILVANLVLFAANAAQLGIPLSLQLDVFRNVCLQLSADNGDARALLGV